MIAALANLLNLQFTHLLLTRLARIEGFAYSMPYENIYQ